MLLRRSGWTTRTCWRRWGGLDDAWRDYLEVLSGLVKGEVAVIIDDTVDHKEYSRGRDVSP